jgi:drug/metabolite transporter (DMT)-like permease
MQSARPGQDDNGSGLALAAAAGLSAAMRIFVLTFVAMLAFAANSVLGRMAIGAGVIDPLTFGLVRLAAGALALAALVALRRIVRGGALWPDGRGRLAGVLGLLVYLVGFSLAYVGIDTGVGALVLFGVVQITMFTGALVAREAVPLRRWLGAGLAFAGLVFLLAPFGRDVVISLPHAGLMALSGVGWGFYSLAGRGARDPLAATAANFVLAALVAGAVALAIPSLVPGLLAGGRGFWLAVLSGAVTSGMGYALWYALVPGLGAARAAVAQLTVPVIASAGGLWLLAEPVSWRFLLASVAVLGGVALASLGTRPAQATITSKAS